MKKFIFFITILIGAYKFYPYALSPNQIKALTNNGAFDENGKPQTILFIADYCEQHCTDTLKHLKKRRIVFTTINISENEESMDLYKSYGGNGGNVPWIVTGYDHVKGSYLTQITAMLSEAYGMGALSGAEKRAIKGHFDNSGSPKLVMYSTERCGYCIQARKYFSDNNIPYTELDINKSGKAKSYYKTLQGRGTPLIYIGYRRITGFNKEKVVSAIQEFRL